MLLSLRQDNTGFQKLEETLQERSRCYTDSTSVLRKEQTGYSTNPKRITVSTLSFTACNAPYMCELPSDRQWLAFSRVLAYLQACWFRIQNKTSTTTLVVTQLFCKPKIPVTGLYLIKGFIESIQLVGFPFSFALRSSEGPAALSV